MMFVLGVGYRVSSLLAFNVPFTTYPNGISLYIKNRRNSKSGKESSKVYLKIKSRVFFRLVPESGFLSYYKMAGFGREVQVGDAEFDGAFYIATENSGVINKLRGDSELRACILRLKDLGFTTFISDGFGHLLMDNPQANVLDGNDLARHLAKIKSSLDLVPSSSVFAEPFLIWVFLLEMLFYGLSGYALSFYPSSMFDSGDTHLRMEDLILKGSVVVAILLVVWALVIFLFLRRSSRGPLLLYDFTLPYFAAAVFGGFMIFADLNLSLDKSPAVVSIARIKEKYSKITGSGKSRRTIYYLSLNFASNPYGIPQRLAVSPLAYSDYNVGHHVEIKVRRGFFDSPYIESVTPSEDIIGD